MADKLKLPKAEALKLINKHIEIGENNLKEFKEKYEEYSIWLRTNINPPFHIDDEREKFIENEKAWIYKTRKALQKIFPSKEEIKYFESAKASSLINPNTQGYSEQDYERKIAALVSIKDFLDCYDEPDAVPTKIAPKIERKFNFIKDKSLNAIIKRDYQELIASIHNKSVKSILVLSGSILETILLDKALANEDKIGKPEKKILEMNLNQLKDELATIDITYKEVNAILDYIKDYRNLIQPGKEKRGEFKINEKDALAVFHNLEAIIEKLSNN